MQRHCDSCGKSYDAVRKTSRYCGGTCRVRASRGAVAPTEGPVAPTLAALPAPGPGSGLSTRTEEELRAANRLDTFLGQSALSLARRIEDGRDTGSAIAALHRELRASMAEAMRGVGAPLSAVAAHKDELAARRASR